jgi:probable phosphoglycerate mutase
MQLIVIRHASTEYNEKELINGTIDEDLSAKGLQQVDGLIASLSSHAFDVVYASPLKRAVQTATPLATHYGVLLYKDARLIEVSLGTFNGQSWGATIPDFGLDSSGLLSTCAYDFRPYGGESADETKKRVQSFLNDLKKKPGTTPLIVTHGGILRWFYYLCTGEKHGRVPNASIHTFTV